MRVRANAAIFALLPLVSGCTDDFTPRTLLSGYRVLGIVASPPEVEADGTVSLTAEDFYDGDDTVTYAWRFCSYSSGAQVGYACADQALEVPVGSEPSVSLALGPDGLDLLESLQGRTLFDSQGRAFDPARGFDVWLKLQSGPPGAKIDTVKRVTIRGSGAGAPNQNPTIGALEVSGDARPGSRITLRVDVDAPESYFDTLRNEQRTEEQLFTWYTTAGETDPGVTFGQDRQTELELPKEAADVQVAVAVRDGRGGLAIARQIIEVR